MKSDELLNEITQQEAAQSALADQQQAIRDRLEFLAAERKSLVYPLSVGDKKAAARAAEIDGELDGLQAAMLDCGAEIARNAGILDELRLSHQAAELAEISEARDHLALEEAGYLVAILDHQAEIEALRPKAEAARRQASDLNFGIVKRGGIEQSVGWPVGSDDRKAQELAERVKVLTARLG